MSQLRFLNVIILAILSLYVAQMPSTKFLFNQTFGPNAHPPSFYSIRHNGLESEFQDSCHSGYLRNQNGKILTFLNLHVGPGYFPPNLGSIQHMIWFRLKDLSID